MVTQVPAIDSKQKGILRKITLAETIFLMTEGRDMSEEDKLALLRAQVWLLSWTSLLII